MSEYLYGENLYINIDIFDCYRNILYIFICEIISDDYYIFVRLQWVKLHSVIIVMSVLLEKLYMSLLLYILYADLRWDYVI